MADRASDLPTSRKDADAPKASEVSSDATTSTASTEKKSIDQKDEIGGPKGPEPTRYGDWEKGGRCIDF